MPAQSRTPERLARGAVHVNYEVGAFRHFAASDLNDSVTIELFLLHARNLIEFLGWRASKYDDDLIANNFVAGWTPPSTPDPTFFKNVLDKIDGHLSHLTWRRRGAARYPHNSGIPLRRGTRPRLHRLHRLH